MTGQVELAKQFARLHVKGDPLILFNVWDAGSARAVQDAGSKAIATGSWSVAAANGYADGEGLPLIAALANLRRIVASVTLPVTLDFEGGYAVSPADLRDTVRQAVEAGAIGVNFEDQVVGGEGLYSIDEHSARIAAVREAAGQAGIPLFINARTDVVLKLDPATHNDGHLDDVLRRAAAYADAGASGFFAPGLVNEAYIEKLCAASRLPVNIMYLPYAPSSKRLAELGVARISYGPFPYSDAMAALTDAARKAFAYNA